LKHAAATHYGHAARAFIGSVQEHREAAVAELQSFLNGGLPLLCDDDASGQVQRVARRFLLCAAAGEMAAEWGLLPWGKGEALQAVKLCFEAWIALRGGAGAAEDTALLEQVMLFIEQHGQSRFQDIEKPEAICVNRVGFRRTGEDRTVYYVLPESFKEMCKGHTTTRAARVLRDAKVLTPEGGRLRSRSPYLPGLGRQRCYVLSFDCGGDADETV
jgi:putative DNA primase/helicase